MLMLLGPPVVGPPVVVGGDSTVDDEEGSANGPSPDTGGDR